MSYHSEELVKKSRKPHVCEACATEIGAGSPYVRYFGICEESNSPFALKYHTECRKEEIAVNRRAGTGGDEWLSLDDNVEGDGEEAMALWDPVVANRYRTGLKRREDDRLLELGAKP